MINVKLKKYPVDGSSAVECNLRMSQGCEAIEIDISREEMIKRVTKLIDDLEYIKKQLVNYTKVHLEIFLTKTEYRFGSNCKVVWDCDIPGDISDDEKSKRAYELARLYLYSQGITSPGEFKILEYKFY
jgi:hypothetical protein